MRTLKRLFARLRNSVIGLRGDERLRDEMESHIGLETDENIRAGMTPDEAYRQARLKFGAIEAIREDYKAEGSLPGGRSQTVGVVATLPCSRRPARCLSPRNT